MKYLLGDVDLAKTTIEQAANRSDPTWLATVCVVAFSLILAGILIGFAKWVPGLIHKLIDKFGLEMEKEREHHREQTGLIMANHVKSTDQMLLGIKELGTKLEGRVQT